MAGITNGFRVYSPEGATWTTTTADTLGTLQWESAFDLIYAINYFSITGSGADTIGFGGARLFGSGLPWYFDDTTYSITIGHLNETDIDKTICLDSAFFSPTGKWVWSPSGGGTIYPDWGGPYCFTIGTNDSISFSGYVYYKDPVPPDTNDVPAKNMRIEMWDDDLFPNPDDSLGSYTIDNSGYFEIGPTLNEDASDGLDIYFKVYAENEACYVTESFNGDIHKYQTPNQDDMLSGEYVDTVNIPLSSSGPFFIAGKIQNARNKWIDMRPTDIPSKVQVRNEVKNTFSHYNPNDNYIHIEAGNNDYSYPHTFKTPVIYHEYGHFIEDEFDFFDASIVVDHDWLKYCDPYTAACEGFASFFCTIVNDSPMMKFYGDDFTTYGWVNAENGETTHDFYGVTSGNNAGDGYESVICGILWDIYDDVDDDYSTYGVLGAPNDSLSDGVGDTLTLGIDNILETLLDRNVDGHQPDNIAEFWDAWFQNPSFGHDQAMQDIWYEHGISMCCQGTTGNINNDPNDEIDISDLVYLVLFQFSTGPAPLCSEEADVDGSGSIDISDVVYLVSYMFGSPIGPAPVSCTYAK